MANRTYQIGQKRVLMRKTITAIQLLVLVLLGTAQIQGAEYSERYSAVSLFYLYNNWQEDLEGGSRKVGEGVLGLSVDQAVTSRLSVSVWSTFTRARLNHNSSEAALSSLNDTRIGARYSLGDNTASLRFSANLPTGPDALKPGEYAVAAAVADNSRKFAVRRFGQGLDLSGEAYWHPRVGDVGFSAGGGYTHKGGYRLLSTDEFDYKFGDEIFGKLAASVKRDRFGLEGSVRYAVYTEDEFESRSVYQSGNSIILTVRADYIANAEAHAGLSVVTRGNARILSSDNILTEEALRSGRNEYYAYAGGSLPLGNNIRGLGRLEYKYLTSNEYDVGTRRYRPESDYAGLGLGLSYQLSLYFAASAAGNYFIGSADGRGVDGFGFYTAVSLRYW